MGKAIYYINKFKGKSVNEIITKTIKKTKDNIDIELKALKYKLKPKTLNYNNFNDFSTNSIFLNLKDINLSKKEIEVIIFEANRICKHEFPILGMEAKPLGEIEWNKDYKSNFIWQNNYYKKIEVVNYFNSSDVKVPWEISRFQHLFILGKAYYITKSEEYSKEFVNQIESWIDKNPIDYSINWTCAMEVAIRSINWIVASEFFKESKQISKEFWSKFNSVLYYNGIFIMNNLENKKHTTNHYLSDLAGLVFLGIYFKNYTIDLKHKEWLIYGLREIDLESKKQINSDGTDYETSTSYHRLVLEIFIYTNIFCERNGINISMGFKDIIESMLDFIFVIKKQNGTVPIIGDADDGRVLITYDYYNWIRNDFKFILALGSMICKKNYLGSKLKEFKTELIWIFDDLNNIYSFVEVDEGKISKEYIEGGYFILKNKELYCCIRCGKLSCNGQGGHSHNDQLSFELSYKEKDIFVDPGVYLYTSDVIQRNIFRSTSMHNTVSIDGVEQNDISKYKLFEMKEQSFGEKILFNENTFEGKHIGFKNKIGATHIRNITIDNNDLIISDKIISDNKSPLNSSANFILDYDIEIETSFNNIVIFKEDIKFELDTRCNNFNIDEVFISKKYGEKLRTKRISFKFDKEFNLVIRKIN